MLAGTGDLARQRDGFGVKGHKTILGLRGLTADQIDQFMVSVCVHYGIEIGNSEA